MSETYTVLQRCKDNYAEVVVLDFGDGYMLSVITREAKYKSAKTTYRGILWEDGWGKKVWETTSFCKAVVMGAARRAKEVRKAIRDSRSPEYII